MVKIKDVRIENYLEACQVDSEFVVCSTS